MLKSFLKVFAVSGFLLCLMFPVGALGQKSMDNLEAPPDYSKSKSTLPRTKVLRPRERQQRLKDTLANLYKVCNSVWKAEGMDKPCTAVKAVKNGLKIPTGITLKASGDKNTFSGAALDSKIRTVYAIDSAGNINRKNLQTRSRSRTRMTSPSRNSMGIPKPRRDIKAKMGGSEICAEDVDRVKKLYTELYRKDPMQCGKETIKEAITDWDCGKRSGPQGPCKGDIVACSMPVTCTLDAMGEYKRFEQVLAVARQNDPKFWVFYPNQSKFVKLLGNIYTACKAHWDKNGNSAECKREAFPKQYFEKIPGFVSLDFSGDRDTYFATATDKKTGYRMEMLANGKISMKKPQ